MKLNLVPTYVSKDRQGGAAILIAGLLLCAGIVIAVAMIVLSRGRLDAARSAEADARNQAAEAKATSDVADAIMADPRVHSVVRNINLANAMEAHSAAYPDLYDKVRQYVPAYYRLTSMSAAPVGDDSCAVTLQGVVSTFQQYADLGLALMRIPGAVSYSPAGFTVTDPYVPNLTPTDLNGRRIRPGEENIPDDPLARLDYLEAHGTSSGYLNEGNWGDASADAAKGAMPNASLVTITVVLKSDLGRNINAGIMTPDPRATLAAGGGATSSVSSPTTPFGPPPSTTNRTTTKAPANHQGGGQGTDQAD